jgi:hypothetical protein
MPNGSGSARCSPPTNRKPGIPPTPIGASSMASWGFCAPGRLGAISPSAMAPGGPSPAASTGGRGRAPGSVSSTPSHSELRRPGGPPGGSTTRTAPSCAPTSMRQGREKGAGSRGARPQPRRMR